MFIQTKKNVERCIIECYNVGYKDSCTLGYCSEFYQCQYGEGIYNGYCVDNPISDITLS